MRFSSPGVLPSSGAFGSPLCWAKTPLSCRSRGPAGEGRDRAGPSSRDEVRVLQPVLHRTQERRWVTTNLGPVRSEPGPSQAPVQDVDAETHLSMHPSVRLVRSWRTRTFMSRSSLDTDRFSALRSKDEHISTRSSPSGYPCRLVSSPRSWSPCSIKGSRHSRSQLPRRLAHTGPVSSAVVRTSAGWGFGSTGKGANSPMGRGSLFSVWSWTRSTSQHVSQ